MNRYYYVYILASRKNGTLYVGVTNNLKRRISEYKDGLIGGFTKEYGIPRLVYFEQTTGVRSAIASEKCIKKWNRQWKIYLIEKENGCWNDLFEIT